MTASTSSIALAASRTLPPTRGNDEFVHASPDRGCVAIDSLIDPHHGAMFCAARRQVGARVSSDPPGHARSGAGTGGRPADRGQCGGGCCYRRLVRPGDERAAALVWPLRVSGENDVEVGFPSAKENAYVTHSDPMRLTLVICYFHND